MSEGSSFEPYDPILNLTHMYKYYDLISGSIKGSSHPDSGKHGMTEPSAERSAELFSKTSEKFQMV